MTDTGVKTLISFGVRLSQLEETKDADEATKLLTWLRSGGLESLKPTLDLYLEEMQLVAPDIYKFKVRLFTQWKSTPFQAASFNTLEDLRDQIAKEFKIPLSEFGVGIDSLRIPPGRSDKELIGARLRGMGLKSGINMMVYPFQLYVEGQTSLREKLLPNVHWFEDSKGQFTVPTEIMRTNGQGLRFLVPITRETGIEEFVEEVERILEPRGIVSFRGPFLKGGEEEEWPEEADVFEEWYHSDFEPLRLEEIGAQGESRLQVVMREIARGNVKLSNYEPGEEPNVEYFP